MLITTTLYICTYIVYTMQIRLSIIVIVTYWSFRQSGQRCFRATVRACCATRISNAISSLIMYILFDAINCIKLPYYVMQYSGMHRYFILIDYVSFIFSFFL